MLVRAQSPPIQEHASEYEVAFITGHTWIQLSVFGYTLAYLYVHMYDDMHVGELCTWMMNFPGFLPYLLGYDLSLGRGQGITV